MTLTKSTYLYNLHVTFDVEGKAVSVDLNTRDAILENGVHRHHTDMATSTIPAAGLEKPIAALRQAAEEALADKLAADRAASAAQAAADAEATTKREEAAAAAHRQAVQHAEENLRALQEARGKVRPGIQRP